MTVSSRTPEGYPSHCPLCGAETKLEYSEPAGDAPCPSCGCLLWKSEHVLGFVQNSLSKTYTIPAREIAAGTLLEDLRTDSLDFVELVMELEDEYAIAIPDEHYGEIRTIEDLVRFILDQQLGDPR